MKIIIFGGTGFIGKNLTRELQANGHEVTIVSRSGKIPNDSFNTARTVTWRNTEPLDTLAELTDMEAIINLAGESIGNRRWTSSVKQEILDSRIRTTRAIVSAINSGLIRPKVLINASAVGFYGFHQDEEITEDGQAGQDFLAQVCSEWEKEANTVQNNATRVITLRIGVVLGSEGALNRMVRPFKLFLGGPLGNGNQWLSWIHVSDLVSLIRFTIEHDKLNGPVNATAPQPVKMNDFCSKLGEVLRRPSWIPVPEIALRLILGQMAEMLVYGQRVLPHKALTAGYRFKFTSLKPALEDILGINK